MTEAPPDVRVRPKPSGDLFVGKEVVVTPDVHGIASGETPDFSTFIDTKERKHGKKTSRLTEDGRIFIKKRMRDLGLEDDEGNLRFQDIRQYIKDLKDLYQNVKASERTDEQKFSYLTVRSLEMRLLRAEQINTEEAIKATNSPWNSVVDAVANIDQYKALPRAFVENMMRPLGHKVFMEVQSFTDDSLSQDLLFHTFSDQLATEGLKNISNLSQVLGDPEQVSNRLSQLMISALGGTIDVNASTAAVRKTFETTLHKALFRARFEAEEPRFLLELQKGSAFKT